MIYKLDQEGNVVASYDSVAEAVNDTDGSPAALKTNIHACLRGTRQTAGGFRWRTDDDPDRLGKPPADLPLNEPATEEGLAFEFSEEGPSAKCSGTISGQQLEDIDQILAMCRVDMGKWEVKRHTIKTWQTTLKRRFTIDADTGNTWKEGVPIKRPIYEHEVVKLTNTGFTIDLALRANYRERLLEVLTNHIAPALVPVRPRQVTSKPRTKAVELAIFDHHLGKQGFDSQTLKPIWSIDEAMAEYQRAVTYALEQIDPDTVAQYILPYGNDLIHIDSGYGTTTSGTRVADDELWLRLFQYAKEAVVLAATSLSQYSDVHLIGIPGNHDQTGVLALSEVVRAVFDGEPGIITECDPRGRSWKQFGRNLVGWHHGEKCDPRKAHTMMLSDVPHLLEREQYRAMHVGHTHRSATAKAVFLDTQVEEFGIDYEICPSLCPTDAWHDKNLYIGNLRRSKIFVYDYDKGLAATHFYTIGR